jgi:hypothetical protein
LDGSIAVKQVQMLCHLGAIRRHGLSIDLRSLAEVAGRKDFGAAHGTAQ